MLSLGPSKKNKLELQILGDGNIHVIDVANLLIHLARRIRLKQGKVQYITLGELNLAVFFAQGSSIILHGKKLFRDDMYLSEDDYPTSAAMVSIFGNRQSEIVEPLELAKAIKVLTSPNRGYAIWQMDHVNWTAREMFTKTEEEMWDLFKNNFDCLKQANLRPDKKIEISEMKTDFQNWYNKTMGIDNFGFFF